MALIIGHGPSADGRGWGNRIDAYNGPIVRMWDCDWQKPVDYGTRYDWGVYTLAPRDLAAFDHTRKREPRAWLAYDVWSRGGAFPNTHRAIDPREWVQMARDMGAESLGKKLDLTRGTAAALFAMSEGRNVTLLGFDMIVAGRIDGAAYSADYCRQAVARYGPGGYRETGFPVGTMQTKTHDLRVEYPLMLRFADEYCVRLEVWE